MSVCISSQFKDTLKRTAVHDFLLHLHQSQKCEEDVGTRPIYTSSWQDRRSVSIWPPFARESHSVKFTPGLSWTEVQPGCAALTTVKYEFRMSNCDGKQKWGEQCWQQKWPSWKESSPFDRKSVRKYCSVKMCCSLQRARARASEEKLLTSEVGWIL